MLTDYLEFRWYARGEWRRTESLGSRNAAGGITRSPRGASAVLALLSDFLAHEPSRITEPQELAERMARLTRLVRDVVVQSFERGLASRAVAGLRDAFEEVLIPHLTVADFADMFSQTVAYGLFAARANHSDVGVTCVLL